MCGRVSLVDDSGLTSSSFQRIIESKWSDVALIAGCAALLVIGILASTGIFNLIGTTNAAHLSYGMYAGATLFLLAEIAKIAIKYARQNYSHAAGPTPTDKDPLISFPRPVPKNYTSPSKKQSVCLTQEEIQSLKTQAIPYANTHYYPDLDLKSPNPNGLGIISDASAESIETAQKYQLGYILYIIDDKDFQKDPVAYMKAWNTREDRAYMPSMDIARHFFIDTLDKMCIFPVAHKE